MDDRLRLVALSLGGVFCSGDAHQVGLDDQSVDRLVRAGEVVRVRRGTFILAEVMHRATVQQAFSLRVRAVLRARGEVAASHQSGLALHDMPLYGLDLATVDLVADVARGRVRAGVRTHRDLGYPVVAVDGWPVLTLATCLVQVAGSSSLASSVVAMDAALHQRRCTVADLAQAARSIPMRFPGAAHRAVDRVDPASESVGETLTRLLLADLGFEVASQVELLDVNGRLVARVDFVVEGWVVVEFDGAMKYGGAVGREALVAEKRRESSIVELGYEVVRLVWADLDHPAEVLRRIRAALARVALRRPA